MSIGPVDYQILMPKVNELAKVQNEEQQKLLGQAKQQAESAVKQANIDTESVHSQKEAQKSVIAEKQKGRNGNKEKREKNKDHQDDNEIISESEKPKLQRHTIDIRI